MGLLFTIGILAQVGACPKEIKNTQRKIADVLSLGHHLRGSAMLSTSKLEAQSKSSSSPSQALGAAFSKWTLSLHTNFVYNDPHMNRKIIS